MAILTILTAIFTAILKFWKSFWADTKFYDVGFFVELKDVLNSFRLVYNRLAFVILRKNALSDLWPCTDTTEGHIRWHHPWSWWVVVTDRY